MARGIRKKTWSFKPPLDVGINWGHPLANGLKVCFPLNEGAGYPFERITSYQPIKSNTLAWVKAKLPFSMAHNVAGATANFLVYGFNTQSAYWDFPNPPISCFALASNDSNTAAYRVLIGTGSSGSARNRFAFGINSSDNLYMTVRWASDANSSLTAPIGNAAFGYAYDGVNARFFSRNFDTSVEQTATQSYTTTPNSTGDAFGIGGLWTGSNTTGTFPWNGKLYLLYLWQRVLSLDEMKLLTADPYVLFTNPAPRVRYFFIPAAAAVASISDESFTFSMN